MNKMHGGPAFPHTFPAMAAPLGDQPVPTFEPLKPTSVTCHGMTVRDYFAAHAPITMEDARNHWKRTTTSYGGNWPDMSVLLAVLAKLRGEYADTMMAERAP